MAKQDARYTFARLRDILEYLFETQSEQSYYLFPIGHEIFNLLHFKTHYVSRKKIGLLFNKGHGCGLLLCKGNILYLLFCIFICFVL